MTSPVISNRLAQFRLASAAVGIVGALLSAAGWLTLASGRSQPFAKAITQKNGRVRLGLIRAARKRKSIDQRL